MLAFMAGIHKHFTVMDYRNKPDNDAQPITSLPLLKNRCVILNLFQNPLLKRDDEHQFSMTPRQALPKK
jgi:hypothetical protein